jgi:hypothetical protein
MTRDQAKAILANLDLIRHFADGGDIGHRLINCHGEFVYTSPTDKITLSNLRSDRMTGYVRVKTKLVWNSTCGMWERKKRAWPERIPESEIIK